MIKIDKVANNIMPLIFDYALRDWAIKGLQKSG